MASNERSRYDMEQALAMRRTVSSARRRSPSPPSGSVPAMIDLTDAESAAASAVTMDNEGSSSSEKDVSLALSGLESAEALASSSDPSQLDEAMKLYELSIERLIKYLNSTKGKSKNAGGISRDVVAERVRAALTEAEELKGRIKAARGTSAAASSAGGPSGASRPAVGRRRGAAKKAAAAEKAPPPKPDTRAEKRRGPPAAEEEGHNSGGSWGVSTVASAISSAFGGGGGRSKSSRALGGGGESSKPPAAASESSGGRGAPSYAAATASSRRKAQNNATGGAAAATAAAARPSSRSRQKQPHQPRTSQPSAAPAPARQRRRRTPHLNYSSDPLVKTIKSDLYVDSSSISTRWDDIAGLEKAKRSMQEAAILPLLRPDLYTGLRTAPRGILLYGPPGTGKTMLVKAVARESKCILFACTASALTSKWHGEGEKLVRTLFRMAADVAPSILFFDEIDALLSKRRGDEHEASRRFKTEFMVQMDGIVAGRGGGGGARTPQPQLEQGGDDRDENGDDDEASRRVLILGCTNCPWDLDDAVMRRFQRRIYVPLPDAPARRYVFESMLRKAGEKGHNLTKKQISRLVDLTEGYSCSDITSVGQEAAFGPLRELGGVDAIREVDRGDVRPVRLGDFEEALANGKKSVSRATLERYGEWEKEQAGSGMR